jgi:outer membrane protein assembly factor BamD
MNKILIILLVITTLTSCSEYQKALKSEDPAKKAEVAKKLFDQEKYSKAIRLYEQAAPSYKAKPQGEQVFYYFSKAYYETEQYYLAGYQLESYAANYPKSEKREEANFLSAECYYKLSPRYSLDQIDTQKALSKLQKFIDTYPNSTYLPKANVYVKELREKEEKKVFEVAKQYNEISDFKAAIKALDNFIADYPGTPLKEQALFYRFDAAYKLAMNSVPNKKQERLNFALNAYSNLLKFKSDTEFKEKADKMFASIETELQQFSK